MQIVIDIPEKLKKQIDEGKAVELYIPLWLAYSIANGTPLPKGHGRLIDADSASADLIKHTNAFKISEVIETAILCQFFNSRATVIDADPCDNDCEHCERVTCPKMEGEG